MPLPREKRYTYADLLALGEQERYELIDGELIMLASPTYSHQMIVGEIFRQISNYLRGRTCKAVLSPFDVRLFETDDSSDNDVDTVVIPDLSIICDRSKLDHRGCKGAPDMVVEVLSPSTQRQDRMVKLNLYQKAGVREYWIVEPATKTVQVFQLIEGFFHITEVYGEEDQAKVNVLDDCTVDLKQVFE